MWFPSVLDPTVCATCRFILMDHIGYLEINFVYRSMIIRSWDTEIPIFGFSAFFVPAILKMPQEREVSPNFPANIRDSYSKGSKSPEKCQFEDLWEGFMTGLARLGPTKFCMHDGAELIFLELFIRGFLASFWHKSQHKSHNFGIKWKSRISTLNLSLFQ